MKKITNLAMAAAAALSRLLQGTFLGDRSFFQLPAISPHWEQRVYKKQLIFSLS